MNTADPVLLFNWDPPRPRTSALVAFVIVSLLFHLLGLYLFQIVYPQIGAPHPPPARVSFISNTSEEGRALLRWIESEDPALASATQRPPETKLRALPKIDHIPSYMNRKPALKEIPAPIADLRAPTALPPGPAPISRSAGPSRLNVAKTAITFSEELAPLGEAKIPEQHFAARTNEQPDSVRFRVAVNSRGEIRHAFRINSSGDPELDQEAHELIALTRFPSRSTAAGDDVLVWGVATVNWGNDITRGDANEKPGP